MKRMLLTYFALLLILGSLFTMPLNVTADDNTDSDSDGLDLETAEEIVDSEFEEVEEDTFAVSEIETMDIPVNIVWVHGDNSGVLPASVDLYLYDEAGVEVSVVTVSESDGWVYTFTELSPEDYTVRQGAVDNYGVDYSRDDADNFTVRNTYIPVIPPVEPETINIPVEIIWEHGFNEGPFPASVDIYLYDEAGVEVAMATVDASDGWYHTFTNLEPGDYTVREAAIENYDIVYVREDAGIFRVNNIYSPAEVPVEPETMNVPIHIVWDHGDNTGPFPTSVDIYLYDENGVEIDMVTVDASDDWSYTFTDMAIQDYTVREAAIENYDIVYARDDAGNFTVTNTYIPVVQETMDIYVDVVWVHGDNEGTLPTSVDLYLYDEAGVEVDVVTVDEADGWQHIFTDLEPGDYTVREAAIENYDIFYARDDTGNFTVTNTYIPVVAETMDILVDVVWVHGDNTAALPTSVDLYLYDEAGAEVAVVTIDETDGWQHTFTDLEPGDYTVWEAAIEDYVATYARDEAGKITITNTYFTEAPETMDIPVEVIWVHGDNKGPFPTSVDIYLYDEAGVEVERITIDGAEGWQVTFINLEPGEYTVREAAIENYDINYARDESGKITITNTYLPSVQETINILVDVVWVHGENKGPFPASVDLYLYHEAGVLVDTVKVDASDDWQHTFTDLVPGDYTVREAAIKNYDIAYAKDEAGNFTITNTYIPVKKPVEPSKPEAPTKPGEPTQPENPIAELPATGIAVSNTILIVAGVLLALGAALLIFTRRRSAGK